MAQPKLMLYLIAAVVLLNCVNAKAKLNCNDISGYYWREYINEIPSDAIQGGTDKKDNPTYIGQTVHPGGPILPGYINVDQQKMFYEQGSKEQSSTKDVKILCSRQPEQFQWIITKLGDSVEKLALVISGHDNSRPLAIGRKIINTGVMAVGKVIISDNKFLSLHLSNDGQGWSENGQFEVLVYNTPISLYAAEPFQECNSKIVNINVY